MRTRARFSRIALCGLFVVLAAAFAHAATVRGRLVHPNGYPAADIAVTVSNPQIGRSSPAQTGADGMYYIFNIPPGSYFLEIWIHPGGAPIVYQIQVYEPYTDIPQIGVP
jgi:hypothetical protein